MDEEPAHIGRLLRERGVVHVVDVGANVGSFARSLREEGGFAGRIDSFEPASATFQMLAAAAANDPGWHVHQCAIGDAPGELTLNLFPGSSEFASLHAPTKAGKAAFGSFVRQKFVPVGTEQVQVVTLDDAVDARGPVYLKIDTQGHDWQVIAGASRLLERAVVLSMELSFVQLYEGATPAHESLARLAEMGWTLAGFYPVATTDDPLVIGEADALFVRVAEPKPSGPKVKRLDVWNVTRDEARLRRTG